jgi:hypothetical protein
MYLGRNSCIVQGNEHENFKQDAIFDCDVLVPCQVTCEGPHKNKLRKVCKECGCIVEWFFHSVWLKSIVSLLVFALMNASRQAFVDGLCRVLWKSLHPGTFTVSATCDADCNILSNPLCKDPTISSAPTHISASVLATADGDVVVDDDDVQQVVSPQSTHLVGEMKEQIEWNSFVFRMSGIALMFAALLLNVVWIIIVRRSPDASTPNWIG